MTGRSGPDWPPSSMLETESVRCISSNSELRKNNAAEGLLVEISYLPPRKESDALTLPALRSARLQSSLGFPDSDVSVQLGVAHDILASCLDSAPFVADVQERDGKQQVLVPLQHSEEELNSSLVFRASIWGEAVPVEVVSNGKVSGFSCDLQVIIPEAVQQGKRRYIHPLTIIAYRSHDKQAIAVSRVLLFEETRECIQGGAEASDQAALQPPSPGSIASELGEATDGKQTVKALCNLLSSLNKASVKQGPSLLHNVDRKAIQAVKLLSSLTQCGARNSACFVLIVSLDHFTPSDIIEAFSAFLDGSPLEGSTLLHLAVKSGDLRTVQEVLSWAGLYPALHTPWSATDVSGMTPLHLDALLHKGHVARSLMMQGNAEDVRVAWDSVMGACRMSPHQLSLRLLSSSSPAPTPTPQVQHQHQQFNTNTNSPTPAPLRGRQALWGASPPATTRGPPMALSAPQGARSMAASAALPHPPVEHATMSTCLWGFPAPLEKEFARWRMSHSFQVLMLMLAVIASFPLLVKAFLNGDSLLGVLWNKANGSLMAPAHHFCYELVLTITNTVACMLSSKWGTLPLLESGVGGLTTFWRHISYLPLILESGTLNFQSRLVLSTLGPVLGALAFPTSTPVMFVSLSTARLVLAKPILASAGPKASIALVVTGWAVSLLVLIAIIGYIDWRHRDLFLRIKAEAVRKHSPGEEASSSQ
eukprot:gene192-3980_t